MNFKKSLLSICGLCLSINVVLADDNILEQTSTFNKMDEATGWSFSIGNTSFDSQTALEEGIDDSAFSFDFAYTGYKENFIYAVGMSGMLLSDNESFSQGVTGGFGGGYSTASSSANAFGFFGEVGYSHVLESGNVSFDLLGGLEVIWSERSIANCSNCYSEDIDLDSGLYLKPRVTFYKDSGFAFSIAYQKYLSADLEGGISLNFAWYH
jgi:hypothetical protein